LERTRPGFFSLRDLEQNRPTPNYLLHEGAHAVAHHQFFGKADVRTALRAPENLLRVISGEAFAMTAEYLAACSVSGTAHRWLFSINSYRHRTQMKAPLARLAEAYGLELVVAALFAGFLQVNYQERRLPAATLAALLERLLAETTQQPLGTDSEGLRVAVRGATRMSPAFLQETARLFLTRLGYPRRIERVLDVKPLQAASRDPGYWSDARALLSLLVDSAGV
jgi:hypothetical protein